MIIEFEKRIFYITEEIRKFELSGFQDSAAVFKAVLEEVERLYAFYKSQMVEKGRIIQNNE